MRPTSTALTRTLWAAPSFDSQWSSHLSTLFGLYYEHESRNTVGLLVARANVPPFGNITQVQGTQDSRVGKSYAVFGNVLRTRTVTHVDATAECQSPHPQNARARSWSWTSLYVGTQK